MKLMSSVLMLGLVFTTGSMMAQEKQQINLADSTGLPGDHFSLQGALGMFKESASVEDFEKRLNSKDNAVNNLDLNGDGKVDYVRVVADKKDDSHILVLQVPVSKTEIQDVAVIEIEKKGDQSAYLQILGDETLYGETIVVEPKEDGEPGDPGVNKKGPAGYSYGVPYVQFNVWYWPCVRFMYAPVYVVYISPWYWDYWPGWWSPWYPYSWSYFYMHNWHWHHHYHYAPYHRTTYAHAVYAPRRSRSETVYNRTQPARQNYQATQTSTGRPRPGAVMSKPGTTRPATKPATRPGTDPSQVRPARPQTKPQMEQAPGKPKERPQTRPVPQERPQTKPQTRPQSRPEYDQPSRPQSRPEVKPQTRPQMQQPSRPQSKPVSRPPGGQQKGGGSKGNQR